jgi:hypothetical protein
MAVRSKIKLNIIDRYILGFTIFAFICIFWFSASSINEHNSSDINFFIVAFVAGLISAILFLVGFIILGIGKSGAGKWICLGHCFLQPQQLKRFILTRLIGLI